MSVVQRSEAPIDGFASSLIQIASPLMGCLTTLRYTSQYQRRPAQCMLFRPWQHL
ncbi:MAG: hypothetical protein Q4A61_02490 [Porphyromonadaceae bacterium]|nr:hypothetical protein [Porphyromonadaceae bacterium]